ncbi:hypothetical protein NL108_013902 [Boleophthalmus pectinirostris]|nr:hypothetical protein NL108_013902 [Boleophthalmus pectinirostris]
MTEVKTGIVTTEDHGRGGSHHSEERRVLGDLLTHFGCFVSTYAATKINYVVSDPSKPPGMQEDGRKHRLGAITELPVRAPVEKGKMAKRKKSHDQPPRTEPSVLSAGWVLKYKHLA